MFNFLKRKVVLPVLRERVIPVIDDIAKEMARLEDELLKDIENIQASYEKWAQGEVGALKEMLDTFKQDLQTARQLAKDAQYAESQMRELLDRKRAEFEKRLQFIEEQLNKFKKPIVPVSYKKTHVSAKAPTRAYEADAGWDVYALDDVFIPTGGQREVKIGLAFETPAGYHIQIHTRSSHGKVMLRCHLGIVDAGYRNELSIWMHNFGSDNYVVKAGSKVCQLLFLPVPNIELKEVRELNPSERGLKGHGSSGQ